MMSWWMVAGSFSCISSCPLRGVDFGSVPRQRENLEGAAVKGDEVLVNEPVPCQDELVHRDSQKGADLVIAVKRQTVIGRPRAPGTGRAKSHGE